MDSSQGTATTPNASTPVTHHLRHCLITPPFLVPPAEVSLSFQYDIGDFYRRNIPWIGALQQITEVLSISGVGWATAKHCPPAAVLTPGNLFAGAGVGNGQTSRPWYSWRVPFTTSVPCPG